MGSTGSIDVTADIFISHGYRKRQSGTTWPFRQTLMSNACSNKRHNINKISKLTSRECLRAQNLTCIVDMINVAFTSNTTSFQLFGCLVEAPRRGDSNRHTQKI